jgi:hypothetical protein
MPNAVVVGLLRAIEPGHITLSGNLHIIVPAELILPDIPLGSSVTVVVHERADGLLIAESIKRSKGDGQLFG